MTPPAGLARPSTPLVPPEAGGSQVASGEVSVRPPAPQNANSPGNATSSRNAMAAARYQSSGSESISNERLVVLLCERLLRDIDVAHEAITVNKPSVAHDNLIHAQEILEALQRSLDVSKWEGAEPLWALYDFAHGELVAANVTKDAGRVAATRRVIAPLVDAWREAWKSTTSLAGARETDNASPDVSLASGGDA